MEDDPQQQAAKANREHLFSEHPAIINEGGAPDHTDPLFQKVGYLPLLRCHTAAFNNIA
jgi:hypothetical protein